MLKKAAGLMAIWLFLFPAMRCHSQPPQDPVRERIRTRIETAGMPPKIVAAGETILATVALPEFYANRGYSPAWVDPKGAVLPISEGLRHAIRSADLEGLNPDDYHLRAIESLMDRIKTTGTVLDTAIGFDMLTDLDLLMTDAYLVYGSHLMMGRINPRTIDPEWRANRRHVDLADYLLEALSNGAITASLSALAPESPGYGRLKSALSEYREIARCGGWPVVVFRKKPLRKGDVSPIVAELRRRLTASGDLTGPTPASRIDDETFDAALEQGVKAFQRRHGLDPDGIVGRDTRGALNTPIAFRIRQIELNLERWRWLPRQLGDPRIEVNIADFRLSVIEDGRPVLGMRVVVGKPFAQTPVFSARMTYLVFSPYWYVPKSIARDELLPKIRNNPDYLEENNMELVKGFGANEGDVDPAEVDWDAVAAGHFPFRIRQRPGAGNPLGKVKFMFPNPFEIYLHDTSAPDLFSHTNRMFSHGCMRVDKPFELAEYLLANAPGWTPDAIASAMNRKTEQTVLLPRPIAVNVLYTTAWVDETGRVQFRSDIYGRDQRLAEAFFKAPPDDQPSRK